MGFSVWGAPRIYGGDFDGNMSLGMPALAARLLTSKNKAKRFYWKKAEGQDKSEHERRFEKRTELSDAKTSSKKSHARKIFKRRKAVAKMEMRKNKASNVKASTSLRRFSRFPDQTSENSETYNDRRIARLAAHVNHPGFRKLVKEQIMDDLLMAVSRSNGHLFGINEIDMDAAAEEWMACFGRPARARGFTLQKFSFKYGRHPKRDGGFTRFNDRIPNSVLQLPSLYHYYPKLLSSVLNDKADRSNRWKYKGSQTI